LWPHLVVTAFVSVETFFLHVFFLSLAYLPCNGSVSVACAFVLLGHSRPLFCAVGGRMRGSTYPFTCLLRIRLGSHEGECMCLLPRVARTRSSTDLISPVIVSSPDSFPCIRFSSLFLVDRLIFVRVGHCLIASHARPLPPNHLPHPATSGQSPLK
jgi:hypothetical protein